MSKIWVGRIGEPLYEFSMTDIRAGAVREAGILPELYQSDWPTLTSGVSTTGVDRKLAEQHNALRSARYDFPIHSLAAIAPQQVSEDSKEAERDQVSIAVGKLSKALQTVRGSVNRLNARDKRKALSEIARRGGVADAGHIIALADDRNSIKDGAFLDVLYGSLKNHWNPEVREIFDAGHLVPGKRVKEVTSALYGPWNEAYLHEQAERVLEEMGIAFEGGYQMDTTLFWQPLFPGTLNFPDQGFVLKAQGYPLRTVPNVKDRFWKAVKEEGRIISFDHLRLVDHAGISKGTTEAELKEKNPLHPYFINRASPGRAMVASAEVMGIRNARSEKSTSFPKRPSMPKDRKPKTVASSAAFLTGGPKRQEILNTVKLPKSGNGVSSMNLSMSNGGFKDLRELEVKLHSSGQAFIIQNPRQFKAEASSDILGKNDKPVSAEDLSLLQRLETDLMFAYMITMSTQSGAPNHFGRAHLVEGSYFKEHGLWHPDFCTFGLAGDEEKEAYRVYDTLEAMRVGLKSWDQSTYQHHVPTPKNGFVTEGDLKKILGVESFGYVAASYGSASSYLDLAYKDAFDLNYEMSRRGMMTVDGGGTRSAMLGMRMGVLKAMREGYPVFNLGVRSETDVSPLEGNIETLIEEQGFQYFKGEDPRHLHFADRQMHILKMQRLLARQAIIASISHIAPFFAGGKGTVVEKCITRLHNARVQIFGHGLFPGFESNTRIIPIVDVDHEFEYMGELRKIWDMVNAPYTQKQLEWMGTKSFSGEWRVEEALDFIIHHGRSLGFDMDEREPVNLNRYPASPEPVCA